MHIDLLAQILAVAVDHGHLASNPAVGKRRRMKVSKRRPVHLDSAEQIAILLEVAGQLDRGDNVIEVQDRRGKTWTQRPAIQTTGRRAACSPYRLASAGKAATHVRVHPRIDRQGPDVRDAAAWVHRSGIHAQRVYSHMMRRSDEEREGLKALVEDRVLAGGRQEARLSARHGAPKDDL
jgi:hypothetical protein